MGCVARRNGSQWWANEGSFRARCFKCEFYQFFELCPKCVFIAKVDKLAKLGRRVSPKCPLRARVFETLLRWLRLLFPWIPKQPLIVHHSFLCIFDPTQPCKEREDGKEKRHILRKMAEIKQNELWFPVQSKKCLSWTMKYFTSSVKWIALFSSSLYFTFKWRNNFFSNFLIWDRNSNFERK